MTFDPELEVARKAWENYEHHLALKVSALQLADYEAGRPANPVAVRQAAEEACKHLRPANVYDAIRGEVQKEQAEANRAHERRTGGGIIYS